MNASPCVYIVDDDDAVREGLTMVLENAGFNCRAYESAEHFLEDYKHEAPSCLLLDVNLPGLNGPELQSELNRRNSQLPIIFLSAYGNIPITVRTIKAGAVDFLTKPTPSKLLIERIQTVLRNEMERQKQSAEEEAFAQTLEALTPREMEILPLVLEGYANKEIAQKLGISYRTVEIHRTRILQKTGATNFLELARLCETHQINLNPKNGLN